MLLFEGTLWVGESEHCSSVTAVIKSVLAVATAQ